MKSAENFIDCLRNAQSPRASRKARQSPGKLRRRTSKGDPIRDYVRVSRMLKRYSSSQSRLAVVSHAIP